LRLHYYQPYCCELLMRIETERIQRFLSPQIDLPRGAHILTYSPIERSFEKGIRYIGEPNI
jgi:hypothetical protein